MSVDEMLGTYLRLRQELSDAYAAPRLNESHLNRLAEDISKLEQALAKSQPIDEQTSDALPPFQSSSGTARREE